MDSNELYLWTVNGAQGLEAGSYLGFFESKPEALNYLRENTDGSTPLQLYSFTHTPEGYKIQEASIQTAS